MEPNGPPRRVHPMQPPDAPVMTLPGTPPDDPPPDPPRDRSAVPDITVHEITVVAAPRPERSFDSFYRTHRPAVAKAVAFALGDVDLAADATDEAFVRAYERWTKV